jgi:hypothetical protein
MQPENKLYVIKNIRKFVNKVRIIVYNNFGKWSEEVNTELLLKNQEEKKELENILPFQESKNIIIPFIKKQTNKSNNKKRYIINEKNFAEILQNLNARMVSNILVDLTAKGLVETAFDEKINDFVFWAKDNENENLEKPETD